METKKPWYSKTMWLNLVGGLAASAAFFFPQANAVSTWISSNLPAIGMAWGIAGMVLRAVTKGAVSLED